MVLEMQLTIEEMNISEISPEVVQEWETLVQSNEQSGFMQSPHWARFKQSCDQEVVLEVIRNDSGKMIGGSLIYTCPDEKKPTILVSPYGPVIPWNDATLAPACLNMLIEKTKELAHRYNAVTWRIEPRILHPVPPLLHEFARGAADLVPDETLYVDLSQDEDALLLQMKPKCRYNIRLAQKKGVVVREECGYEATFILNEMLTEAANRDDFFLEDPDFFKKLLVSLQSSGVAKLLIAEHEGQALGALVLILHGKTATYLYGGISNVKRNLMAGYALQWAAMQEAKKAGCTIYDFYGYDQFQAPSNLYALFSRFKGGFGGEAKRFIGSQDFVFMDKLVDNVIGFIKDASLVTPSRSRR